METVQVKLTTVPKEFDKNYELPESSELYLDLKRLHERRNALMHLKEDVTYQGKTVQGAETGHASVDDEHEFVKRCRNIVDRILEHFRKFDRSEAVMQASMMPGFAGVWSSTMAKFKAAGHPALEQAVAKNPDGTLRAIQARALTIDTAEGNPPDAPPDLRDVVGERCRGVALDQLHGATECRRRGGENFRRR